MDYKLEALHKQYLARTIIGLGTFLLSFIGIIVFLILSLVFGTTILTLITLICCFIAVVSVIVISSNWVIPKWLEKAEQEYQRELKKIIEKEKSDEIWEELKAANIKAMQKVRDEKLDYIIAHFDTLTNVIDRREWELNQPNIKDTPKQTTLDKKLSGKKK